MATEDDSPDPRYQCIQEGVVVRNDDPRGLSRIKVRIPGLTPDDGGAWALPITLGGGPQRGIMHIPDVGSEAYVFFLAGDPDKPRYLGGHWGKPKGVTDVPTAAREAAVEEQHQLKIWETERFALVFDERGGRERVYLHSKNRGEELAAGSALMIEFDDTNGVVSISGTAGVVIRTLGIVDIQGLRVQINGRVVLPIDKAI